MNLYTETLPTTRTDPKIFAGMNHGLSADQVEFCMNLAHIQTQEIAAHSAWKSYAKKTALFNDEDSDQINDYDPVSLKLKALEKLITQHYISIEMGGELASLKADGFSASYGSRNLGDNGFHRTTFGKQAIAIDPTNILNTAGMLPVALFVC